MKLITLPRKANFPGAHFSKRNGNSSKRVTAVSTQSGKFPLIPSYISASKSEKETNNSMYRQDILKFLDDLQCPLLLLPVVKSMDTNQRIGFFTDLRFTDIPMLAVLAKTAKSLQADVVIFNISEQIFPKWIMPMRGNTSQKRCCQK